jgi:acyl-coenzyme A thioesterase PaaI-like protein
MPHFQFDPAPIAYIQKIFTSPFKFRLAMFSQLPLGFWIGMRVRELNENRCVVTVPYKRLNKNPFRSTFWAVLGMAAEMSSGAILNMLTYKQKPSISLLVGQQTGKFTKKAVGVTTFVCESGQAIKAAIVQAAETGEAVEVLCPVIGYNEAKEPICEFTFTWSMKARSKG